MQFSEILIKDAELYLAYQQADPIAKYKKIPFKSLASKQLICAPNYMFKTTHTQMHTHTHTHIKLHIEELKYIYCLFEDV